MGCAKFVDEPKNPPLADATALRLAGSSGQNWFNHIKFRGLS